MDFKFVTIGDLTVDVDESCDLVWFTINGYDGRDSECVDKEGAKMIVELLTKRFDL